MYVIFSANQEPAENMEELDEDIAVTQSQVNFTCPLTQVDHSCLFNFTAIHVITLNVFFFLFLTQDISILLRPDPFFWQLAMSKMKNSPLIRFF